MSAPEPRREGDRFTYDWTEDGWQVVVDVLYETPREGIVAELTFQSLATSATGKREHLHWGGLPLRSTSHRRSLGNYLAGRADRNPVNSWGDILEYVCAMTARRWRESDPLIDLADYSPNGTETDYLVPVLLPRGDATVLYGNGGAGKSMVALAVAAAVSKGIELPKPFGMPETGEVLYLDWETSAAKQRRRLERLCAGWGVQVPSLHYHRMRGPLTQAIRDVRQWVAELDAVLVVVDSMAGAMEGTPEKSEFTIPFFNALRSLAPASCLVITHVSWESANRERGEGKPFGSVYVHNYARSAWEVRYTRAKNHLYLILYQRKASEAEPSESVHLDLGFEAAMTTLTKTTPGMDADLIQFDNAAAQIRQFLLTGSKTAAEIVEGTGLPRGTVSGTLRRMTDVDCLDVGGGRGLSSRWGLKYDGE